MISGEITLRGVERGLKNMSPSLNRSAADAAAARRIIDRLAGWHATSVVFEKLRHLKGVSAGRLQSAALRLVVDRYRETQQFNPTSTYGIRLKLRSPTGQEFAARLLDSDNSQRIFPTALLPVVVSLSPSARVISTCSPSNCASPTAQSSCASTRAETQPKVDRQKKRRFPLSQMPPQRCPISRITPTRRKAALTQPNETPSSRPITAVTAIASAPPTVTRNDARMMGAPPR